MEVGKLHLNTDAPVNVSQSNLSESAFSYRMAKILFVH